MGQAGLPYIVDEGAEHVASIFSPNGQVIRREYVVFVFRISDQLRNIIRLAVANHLIISLLPDSGHDWNFTS